MEYWFTKVCFLALAGSGAIAVVWAVCRLGSRRLSCRWRYYIWLLPLLLLLLPISMPRTAPVSSWAPIPAAARTETGVEIIQQETVRLPVVQEDADTGTDFVLPSTQADAAPEAGPAVPVPANSAPAVPLLELLGWVWLAGLLFLLVWNGVQAVRLRRLLRRISETAEPWEEELLEERKTAAGIRRPVALRRYAGTGSPFLHGLLRPAIYLPETVLTPAELAQVLTHELIHCRRRDLLVKKLAWLARTVHWFNPLAWLLEREIDYRCELACDEAVTGVMGLEERRSYGLTLIKLMRERSKAVPAAACLAERDVKERLEVLMKPLEKRKGRRVLAAMLALALCLGGVALAAEVNGLNSSGTYQATQFTDLYYVKWRTDGDETVDPYDAYSYASGSGYSRNAAGTALLVDTPLTKSFSAEFTAEYLWSYDYNATAADALSDSTFQVEMTQLDRVIESRGEWVGRFTVLQDDLPIFTDEPGKLVHVPSLDGTQLTALTVGPDGACYFYVRLNFGLSGTEPMDGEAAAQAEMRALEEHPDTAEIQARLSAAFTVDGYTIEPYFVDKFYVNDTLGQFACDLTFKAEGVVAGRWDIIENACLYLEMRPQDVTAYAGDSASGTFFLRLPNGQDREFTGTVSGLNGKSGDMITLRADDGSLAVEFRIEKGRSETTETALISKQGLQRLSEEDRAYDSFSRTCEIDESTKYISTSELPFAIATEGNSVTVRYTGDAKYRAGAQLRSSGFGDWYGLKSSTESQLLTAAGACFQLPKDSAYLELELYQVSTSDGADFIRYQLTLYPGGDGALVAQCRRFHVFNSSYTGAAAEAMLNYNNELVPEFMQG